jgi:hypothetical protein
MKNKNTNLWDPLQIIGSESSGMTLVNYFMLYFMRMSSKYSQGSETHIRIALELLLSLATSTETKIPHSPIYIS